MAHSIKVLRPKPGINRDLSSFESPNYTDGQWVRFYGDEGLALKMQGYKLIDPGTTEIIRTLNLIEKQGSVDIYYGRPSSLRVTNFTNDGVAGNTYDRTPIGFIPDPNNIWSFDQTTLLDEGGNPVSYVIATAIPSGADLNSSIVGTVFWGPINATTPLVPLLSNVGTVSLNNGTQVFVSNNQITENSVVIASINTPDNTPGYVYVSDTMIQPGIGFYINSQGGTNDTSNIVYQILEKQENFVGTATLVAGSVIVNSDLIREESIVMLSYNTPSADLGTLSISDVIPGTSFKIVSNNGADTSKINYSLISFPDITEGTVTLTPEVGGSTATVNVGDLTGLTIFNTSLVQVSTQTIGGTAGKIYSSSNDIIPEVSFTIKSTSDTDTSTVAYQVYNYPSTSGGVVSVGGGTFLFIYGNNGVVQWSARGLPNVFPAANKSFIASNKIIQGLTIRSGGVPGVLFWSLDSLIRGVYNPNGQSGEEFTFDTIEDNISVLSPDSVIKYKSEYFWVGTDQFYSFDGTVQKITNNMTTNYFFDNLNRSASEKVFGLLLPKYGEILWFWPKFPATENTDILGYNIPLKCWFTAELPRSTGLAATSTFPWPIMADSTALPYLQGPPIPGNPPAQVYGIWLHEYGWDRIQNGQFYSIPSHFATDEISIMDDNPNDDRNIRVRRVETNFQGQVGPMTLTVLKKQFPNDIPIESEPYVFDENTDKIDMDEQAGIISFRFDSNTVGGRYYMGKILVEYEPGDPRVQD